MNGSYKAYKLQIDLGNSAHMISEEMKAIQTKKQDLLLFATQQEMTDNVKKLAMQQIDEEYLQEASLRATYAVLINEADIMRRCFSCPRRTSFSELGEKEIQEYCVEQLANLKEYLSKIIRQTFKRTFSIEQVKELENMRLMATNRSADDLDKIYERLMNKRQNVWISLLVISRRANQSRESMPFPATQQTRCTC